MSTPNPAISRPNRARSNTQQDTMGQARRLKALTSDEPVKLESQHGMRGHFSRKSVDGDGLPLLFETPVDTPLHLQPRSNTLADLFPSNSLRQPSQPSMNSGNHLRAPSQHHHRRHSGNLSPISPSSSIASDSPTSTPFKDRGRDSSSGSLVSKLPKYAISAAKQITAQSAAAVNAVARGATAQMRSSTRSNSSQSQTDDTKDVSVFSEEGDSLRHEFLPSSQEFTDSNGTVSDVPRIIRIYREDGTFGTFACNLEISCETLLRRAGQKFFIPNIDDYRLLMRSVSRVRVLDPHSLPVKDLKEAVRSIGAFKRDKLLQGQDFHSYLFQIQLVRHDGGSMPETTLASFMKRPQRLLIKNLDLIQFPDEIVEKAHKIEILDISRSAANLMSESFARKAINLKSLRLSVMYNFTNVVPKYLELFNKLEYLNLSRNALENVNLDFSVFTSLHHLNLSGNKLTELPHGLELLPLQSIKASTNYLTTFGSYVSTIVELDLSYNVITQFEIGLHNLKKLKRLYLSNNKLRTLPTELELLPELELLDVRCNMLMEFSSHALPLVETLLVSHNPVGKRLLLSGANSLPVPEPAPEANQPKLPNVRFFDMEYSCFKFLPGKTMNIMTVINLKGTNLIALPDDFFENLPLLEKIQLDSNSLTRLPPSLGLLQHLHYLSAANNSLTYLPEEICHLPSLKELDVHANNLKTLPSEFWRISSLRTLNISSNVFETLPTWTIPRHEYFQSSSADRRGSEMSQESSSSFSEYMESHAGTVNPSERPCINLARLYAADNRLTEDMFESISHMYHLETLNISFNQLSEIPSGALRHFPCLRSLHACGNMLTALPQDDLEHLPVLEALYISNNKLHSLPAELAKNKELVYLDVSANQLRYNVANWPFDWNWRFNQKLRFLNLSSNMRLEIKRMHKNSAGSDQCDYTDFCVLPSLATLGLVDITLIFPSLPEQNENKRVRAYGSDLTNARIGVAEVLGRHHRTINDFVIERFRGLDNEALVGIFDGQRNPGSSGNKISKLAQEHMGIILKRELDSFGEDVSEPSIHDALRRAFLAVHREIGNASLLPPEELAHTFLGQHSSVTDFSSNADRSSGTGVVLAYMRGQTLYFASVGGSQCIVARAGGDYLVLNMPHLPDDDALKQIRASGATMVDEKIDGLVEYSRLLGCFDLDIALKRSPDVVSYQLDNPQEVVIMATAEFWKHVPFETAADIARAEALDLNYATSKLRALAVSSGATEELMVLCVGSKDSSNPQEKAWELSKRRRNKRMMDSSIARLGSEVSPPLGQIAMVFTDIRNSTMLWETWPIVMRAAIRTHSQIMRRSIRLHGGYEVKTEGDAFIVAFQTSIQAMLWALTVQQQLLEAAWPEELLACDDCKPVHASDGSVIFRGLRVRMGLHWGRPVHERDPVTGRMDYFGPMVNKAARISSLALGGQVALSQDFASALKKMETAFLEVDPHMLATPPSESASETSETSMHANAFDHIERAFGIDYETFIDTGRKATTLASEGYTVVELGELKLKGIESPEFIYIVYPNSLRHRANYAFSEDVEAASHAQQVDDNSTSSSLTGRHIGDGPLPSAPGYADDVLDPLDISYIHPMNRDKSYFANVPTCSSLALTPMSAAQYDITNTGMSSYNMRLSSDSDTHNLSGESHQLKHLSRPRALLNQRVDYGNGWPSTHQLPTTNASNDSSRMSSFSVNRRSRSSNINGDLTIALKDISTRLEALCNPPNPETGSWLAHLASISAKDPELAIELYMTRIENVISTMMLSNIIDDRLVGSGHSATRPGLL